MSSEVYPIDLGRRRVLSKGRKGRGPVVYWMAREHRAHDNWSLLYAQDRALALQRPLMVVFTLDGDFHLKNLRHADFLLQGLQETVLILDQHNISFTRLQGNPEKTLIAFLDQLDPAAVVTDFYPIHEQKRWRDALLKQSRWGVWEVDAHNIVPCWEASPKREYAAYTIRKKIQSQLSRFLTPFPELQVHPFHSEIKAQDLDVSVFLQLVRNRQVAEVDWLKPGEESGQRMVKEFLLHRLPAYTKDRNNPCVNGQSNLSPYLHYGQIAPQRVAWEVMQCSLANQVKEVYLEELIVRRELADNFCNYTDDYDRVSCFPEWAKRTLDSHRQDPRPYKASIEVLENAKTKDPLWNGCQRDLMEKGKLHGYLRMYWAKKILEWSETPEEAMGNAVLLNDTYSLDGRDPNGYAGIAWSIGGVHDRAWPERPIFGKIRYMNSNGCKRKFKVRDYLEQISGNQIGR